MRIYICCHFTCNVIKQGCNIIDCVCMVMVCCVSGRCIGLLRVGIFYLLAEILYIDFYGLFVYAWRYLYVCEIYVKFDVCEILCVLFVRISV